jgi:hypothetical protein
VNADISFAKAAPQPCANVLAMTTPCGTPMPVTVDNVSDSAFSRTVSPMGTVRLEASGGSLTAGYARLRSAEELQGSALFKALSGDTITSEAGVGFSPPTDHFTIYIDNVNNAQTGYAVANPQAEGRDPLTSSGFLGGSAQLTLTLRDKTGAALETRTVPLGPGQHMAEFASQRFPASVVSGFEGSIEFSTGQALAKVEAVALRYDNATQDVFTTIPVTMHVENPSRQNMSGHIYIVPSRTSTLYFPQAADGETYRTNFILVNPTDSATTATLDFFGNDGAPLPLPIGGVARTSLTVSLNARGAARLVTDGTSSGIKVGWVRVTAPIDGLGGSAIFQTVVNNRITSEAGVSSSPLSSHFTTYVDSLGFAESGLALCNPSSSIVNVAFNLRNSFGQLVASTTRTLQPSAHMAQFFTQLFPTGFEEFEGTLEVLATGAPVSGVALRYENPGGTVFATTPVVVLP